MVLGGGILEARNPLLLDAIDRQLAEIAPGAVARVLDAPPVAGAVLLGLDYVGASAETRQRLRDSYRATRMVDRYEDQSALNDPPSGEVPVAGPA